MLASGTNIFKHILFLRRKLKKSISIVSGIGTGRGRRRRWRSGTRKNGATPRAICRSSQRSAYCDGLLCNPRSFHGMQLFFNVFHSRIFLYATSNRRGRTPLSLSPRLLGPGGWCAHPPAPLRLFYFIYIFGH